MPASEPSILREPDGTPHVTIEEHGSYATLYGRCNAFPKEEYAELIKEFFDEVSRPGMGARWGDDTDDAYHESHKLDDRDYRDLDYGSYWRGDDWYEKRKESEGV